MKSGVRLIAEERRRQRSRRPGGEFYSLAHDDEHDAGEIARAAAAYAMPPAFRERNQDLVAVLTPQGWYLKLKSGDRIRELVKAGALWLILPLLSTLSSRLHAGAREEVVPDAN